MSHAYRDHSTIVDVEAGMTSIAPCKIMYVLPPKLCLINLEKRYTIERYFPKGYCIKRHNKLQILRMDGNKLDNFFFGPVLDVPNLEYLNLHGSTLRHMSFFNIFEVAKTRKFRYRPL